MVESPCLRGAMALSNRSCRWNLWTEGSFFMRMLLQCLPCLLAVRVLTSMPAIAEDSPLAQYYGFKPVEIFKLTERSGNMLTGDLNHDGLADIITIDNSHSRLDLLIQRKTMPTAKDKPAGRSDVNVIDDSWRFEHRKIPVDHDIAALALGDFNGDGRTDIVYFGNPDQLVIRFQPAQGDWNEQKKQRIPDVAPTQWCMAAGDLDANGLDDLVILGKRETILIYQTTRGVLAPPKHLMNTSDKLGLAQIADLDGDGRQDLCYLAGEGMSKLLGARLQQTNGQLGPEYIFDLERPRAVSLRDVDGKPGHEILTIDSRTGRLKILNIELKPVGHNELPERLIQFGFGKQSSGKDRDVAVGDFDGDGLSDLLVTDPEASRVLFFQQRKGQGLDMGTPFPSLTGIDQIRVADLDGDGKVELVVHSASEKTLGVSRFENDRITFPQSIPTDGDASVIELADLDGDNKPEVVFISRGKKDKTTEYALQAMKLVQRDEWRPLKIGEKTSVSLELKGTPDRMLLADISDDPRPEFLIFQGSKPPQLFGFAASGELAEIVVGGNLGIGTVSAGATSFCKLAGKKGVLVAQENFARHMILSPKKRWEVAEQFNVSESNSKLVAASVVDLNGEGELEIALVDEGLHKLRILRKLDGNYEPWKEIDIGEFPIRSVKVGDLNGDRHDDLVLFGPDKFALLLAGGTSPAIKELASFESQLDKVFPTDVVAGDLNNDGYIDLAMTDTRGHFLEIIQYRPKSGLEHALYFRIYEQKTFRSDDESKEAEPREAVIADVTGDGLADLVLLTQDRLLVYPQDDGK
jgi:hypothetical protein